MYFVVHGEMRLHNGEVVIGRLGPGAVFGEATAVSGTLLLKLEQDAIYSTIASQPAVARSLIEALCAREREEAGGFGLALIRRLVDELHYRVTEDGGNELLLVKKRR
jgi:CRP-like cAMP-binding protein